MSEIVVFRRQLLDVLAVEARSVSSIARELGLKRSDVEDDLQHLIRSARAAGHRVVVEPARCRACGFTFDERKLTKPGKCPACRSTWLYEAQVRIEREASGEAG
jgi:predicted Zn-ribbon and HTH transcriptional regulator